MPRVVLTDAERKERQRERDAGRARSRRRPQQHAVAAPKRSRAARVALQAANMPEQAAVRAAPSAETVEQFMARGGRVQRLPTHWEQMERAA
jgi:hypothetical protein